MPPTVWTIGHSNHPADRFADLIRGAGVLTLVDVRSEPYCKRLPWFAERSMRRWLPNHGIAYDWMPGLGGRRAPIPDSPNLIFRPDGGFQGYADYMDSPEFTERLRELESVANVGPTAYCCAERDWRCCHRKLLSDALAARGWNVLHILADGTQQPHSPTPLSAVVDGRPNYTGILGGAQTRLF